MDILIPEIGASMLAYPFRKGVTGRRPRSCIPAKEVIAGSKYLKCSSSLLQRVNKVPAWLKLRIQLLFCPRLEVLKKPISRRPLELKTWHGRDLT